MKASIVAKKSILISALITLTLLLIKCSYAGPKIEGLAASGNNATSSGASGRYYEVVTVTDDGGAVVIGGNSKASPLLSIVGVRLAIKEALEEGWRIHSVIPVVSGEIAIGSVSGAIGGNGGGGGGGGGTIATSFIVIVEK